MIKYNNMTKRSGIKRLVITIIILIITIIPSMKDGKVVRGNENLASQLSGRILLQVESHGEAWYVEPGGHRRIPLNSPRDAFETMKQTGQGITNDDLSRIPIGVLQGQPGEDDDDDGLNNELEKALETDPRSPDTDNDGYNDAIEVRNQYDPTGSGKYKTDPEFTRKHLGKIFLQVEKNGNAWYVAPAREKRYLLSGPKKALHVMKELGLGISNYDLGRIPKQASSTKTEKEDTEDIPENGGNEEVPSTAQADTPEQAISQLTQNIKNSNIDEAKKYVTPELQKSLEYSLQHLDEQGQRRFADILSSARLSESSDTKKTFTKKIYFSLSGKETEYSFSVKKQPDDSWLINKL